MNLRRRSLVLAPFVVASLILIPSAMISQANAQNTGYAEYRPVLGGATRINPWGALADIVKQAVAPYGWDVQVCYNCAGGENEVIDVEDKKTAPASPTIRRRWSRMAFQRRLSTTSSRRRRMVPSISELQHHNLSGGATPERKARREAQISLLSRTCAWLLQSFRPCI
jgi:hypothetical protein